MSQPRTVNDGGDGPAFINPARLRTFVKNSATSSAMTTYLEEIGGMALKKLGSTYLVANSTSGSGDNDTELFYRGWKNFCFGWTYRYRELCRCAIGSPGVQSPVMMTVFLLLGILFTGGPQQFSIMGAD